MADCRPCAMPLERLKHSKGGHNELPEHHWRAALPGSQMVGHLICRRVCEHFCDADMAGDIDGRKSTSGMLAFLGSVPCQVVELSTCEAEYIAAAIAVCQGVWLCQLLGKLIGEEHQHLWWRISLPSPFK